jgi:hypothetical protein
MLTEESGPWRRRIGHRRRWQRRWGKKRICYEVKVGKDVNSELKLAYASIEPMQGPPA